MYKRPNWSSFNTLKLHQFYRINPNIIGRLDPRLVEGLQCLAQIIHPTHFPSVLPGYCSGTM
ncbi:MAG: hypothetical protein E6I93_12925 [Chloroflexi bacterium]|nr:MAG: hypothetical protein E6I93_12925 [Chloroflexota bacterium]TMF41157.1 MAG: hypothetical protein E6I32_20700 [Chloroflexota bacterium]